MINTKKIGGGIPPLCLQKKSWGRLKMKPNKSHKKKNKKGAKRRAI